MDYQRAYDRLIAAYQVRCISGPVERHHIVPRALGGGDDSENLVSLSPKAHFVAHRLLAKIHGGPMWAALAYMARGGTKSAKNVRVTSRTYALIKRRDAEWRSSRYTKNNPFRGKRHTEQAREKMRGPRASVAGEKHPRYGKKHATAGVVASFVLTYRRFEPKVDTTVRDRINAQLVDAQPITKKMLEHYRRKVATAAAAADRDFTGKNNPNFGNGDAIRGEKNPNFGKPRSKGTRQKIAEKAKRKIACPHCGQVGSISNMKRWHFDNCKHARDQAPSAPV